MGEGDGMDHRREDSACVYIYDPTNKDFSFKKSIPRRRDVWCDVIYAACRDIEA
jgi:hypothetical protein